ncbi:putative bifunctional chorismate mutase/prephenate dehydratase [Actinobacillus pleuropneumoniae]|uniref:Bifunctional chorismate mutase/prephenate dehydratase n=1 Tax=Actinobacillus lignieresii TaxID=720 RepID=A0A380TR61_ACTLI|nr:MULTISPECIES: chorismate mutase [Actinobacillus]KIE90787.1 putative bifunctional chorismate mutase/prephenate dehydratase [Actinobacillus pleuropneumoniae]KIE90942.1 putative bifunctional chorismate mutase/prephenate dehydratase [Actinobacillus pleuropneumoniae]KIE90998.1 putative bifunctional chorismate mutase/prephenate dehydratase [Actinobacillus pleuropneumoniae]KIE96458.1 putative bifunctional chorismate mutase/prephenate dehydratase [Actinobacillus pleuropneumoniae]KIE97626.1 putative
MSLDLSDIRQQITQLDRHLLKLLAERHRLAFDVVRSKEITQKPLRDIEREKALLQALVSHAEAENYQLDPQYVTQIFQRIIEDSVLTQQNYLQNKLNAQKEQNVSIAFLGMRGSYSNMASRQFAKKYQGSLIELSCDSFQQVFDKVSEGEAEFGVLPLENTTSGSINDVYDLLQHTDLAVVGELAYPIKHCVLANGNIELAEIDTLYSHPQVIQQCSQFIQSLNKVHIKYCESSSHAMQMVARLNKPNIVALGNEDGGKLYGLTNIKTDIANQQNNITRFIVVAKQAINVSPQLQTKTLLLMTTSQQAGALADALMVFKQHQIRMTKLESRPIYGKPWEEMFYIELQANIHSENTQQALKALENVTSYIKVLGCYPSEIIEPVKL